MTQDSGLRTQDSGLRTQDSGLRTQDELCSDIDFVIPWVDGSDPDWQAQRALYKSDETRASGLSSEARYRDWGILRYWFRTVEKFAPWVRKIHFVTCGQCPDWLNVNHPKINFVRHEDYIPSEYMPTFSSRPIEDNIFRIRDLSEKFVFFNDDMFINAPVSPEDFFVDNLPCDIAVISPSLVASRDMNGVNNVALNDIQVINRNFDFKANFRKFITLRYGFRIFIRTLFFGMLHYYVGFVNQHSANSYLKSTFIEVWEKEGELLSNTSSHKFRDRSDVNQWLMKYWQLASGKFHHRNDKLFAKGYHGDFSEADIICDIKAHMHKIICINDNEEITSERFEELSAKIRRAYSETYPDKSSFEI